MSDAYVREGKGTRDTEVSSKVGFSACLDEAMLNCGEVALVVEQDGDATKIVSYTLPRRGEVFEEGEVWNAFLAQAMGSERFEDSDRENLSQYLDTCVVKEKGVQETRSVYKYKPCALKVKSIDRKST